jgi:hypothetical protein
MTQDDVKNMVAKVAAANVAQGLKIMLKPVHSVELFEILLRDAFEFAIQQAFDAMRNTQDFSSAN